MKPKQTESGFVAIFTVMFFMIFITVITVGFLRVVSQEQQQSTDSSLSSSALSAARAGVEDAKRALMLYQQGTNSDFNGALSAAFATKGCSDMFGNNKIAGPLDLNSEGKVAGNANLNQYYTCLTIEPYTDDFVGKVTQETSDIVPLRSQDDSKVTSIDFAWHGTSSSMDGQPASYVTAINQLPRPTLWGGKPALMRLQLISAPKGVFNLSALKSQTIFMLPASPGNPTTADFAAEGAPKPMGCTGTPGSVGTPYACNVSLLIPASFQNTQLFLRVTPIYRSTNVKFSLKAADNSIVKFDMVEPIVDSTGRTAEAFRRVQARVRLDGNAQIPEYVLETGNAICKNFSIDTTLKDDTVNCPIVPN